MLSKTFTHITRIVKLSLKYTALFTPGLAATVLKVAARFLVVDELLLGKEEKWGRGARGEGEVARVT